MKQIARYVLVLACCVAMAGCGSGRPGMVKVSGQVTYGGGKWPRPGTVYFRTIKAADGFPTRAGYAVFDEDGRFEAKTFVDGDGLFPGSYQAAIECWKVEPTMRAAGVNYVPDSFNRAAAKSFEVIVEPGSKPIVLKWDIPPLAE